MDILTHCVLPEIVTSLLKHTLHTPIHIEVIMNIKIKIRPTFLLPSTYNTTHIHISVHRLLQESKL